MSSFYRYIKLCLFKKYALFKGRASREEFFSYAAFFIFFIVLWASCIIAVIDLSHDYNLIDFVMLYVPFLFITPLVSVTIRRFHDCAKSGWLFLLLLIPLVNLFGLALLCMRGTPGDNRFGPPDKD